MNDHPNVLTDVDELMRQLLGEAPPVPPPARPVPAAPVQAAPVRPTPVAPGGQGAPTPRSPAAPQPLATRGKAALPPASPPPASTKAALSQLPMQVPTFVTDDLAESIDLQNFGTLVSLSTSRWQGRVKDNKASRDAASANQASPDAFNTSKNLLVGADALLKEVYSALDAARTTHYQLTLPWTTTAADDTGRQRGARLLPNTLMIEYTQRMAHHRQAINTALDRFVPEYPRLIAQAQTKLGGRFDVQEYPPAGEIRQRFNLSFDFSPIPSSAGFGGLLPAQVEALTKSFNQRVKYMVQNALAEAWGRLYEAVTHLFDRLEAYDQPVDPGKRRAPFRDSSLTNLHDALVMLSHSNLLEDSTVAEICDKCTTEFWHLTPEQLRTEDSTRLLVRDKLAKLARRMNELGSL